MLKEFDNTLVCRRFQLKSKKFCEEINEKIRGDTQTDTNVIS
jgi:hypothetical protein